MVHVDRVLARFGKQANADRTNIEPLTCRLNSGIEVLAKMSHGEPYPVTYANRTQAGNKVAELLAQGHEFTVHRGMGRPFYVARANQFQDPKF